MLAITPLYAAVLGLVFVVLSFRTIRGRRAAHVGLGDGGNVRLQRAIRAHANFAEYVPIALLLVAFAELGGAAGWRVHGLCAVLLAGRLIHAWGVSRGRRSGWIAPRR